CAHLIYICCYLCSSILQSVAFCFFFFFFLMIRRPPRSTLFPTRRSSDLFVASADSPDGHLRVYSEEKHESREWPVIRASLRSKRDRKSTRLNSSHVEISYAVFCLKKKKKKKK